jgi:hypothetical protein
LWTGRHAVETWFAAKKREEMSLAKTAKNAKEEGEN